MPCARLTWWSTTPQEQAICSYWHGSLLTFTLTLTLTFTLTHTLTLTLTLNPINTHILNPNLTPTLS